MATVSAGSISLDSTISFTDDLAVTIGSASASKTQSDRRRPMVFQNKASQAFTSFRIGTHSELFNFNTVDFSAHQYIATDYTSGGYYMEPRGTQDRYDYEITVVKDSRYLIPEFDFSEFHECNLDSYQLEFEYNFSTSGKIEIERATTTALKAEITVGSGDTDTWKSASLDNTDGTFVDNFSGLLQTSIRVRSDDSIALGTARFRNIRLTATFTGRTGIKGNRVVAGSTTVVSQNNPSPPYLDDIVFGTYSGDLTMTNAMRPARMVTTTMTMLRFRSLFGGIYPNPGGWVAWASGAATATPTVQVKTGSTVLDTQNRNINGETRRIGTDVTRYVSGSWQGSPNDDWYDPYNLDYYPIINYNSLDYNNLTEDISNLEVRQNNIYQFYSNSLARVLDAYNDVQFIYRVSVLSEKSLDSEFGIQATASVIRNTNTEETFDAVFTGVDIGGIRQPGSAQLDTVFGTDLDPTGIGKITPAITLPLIAEYYPAGQPVYYSFIHDPVDAGGNPIDYSHFVRRAPVEFDLDWEFDKTVSTYGVVRVPNCVMTASWSQSANPIGTGVIIDNAETETFAFSVTASALVLKIPDRYRELLLMPETRTYNLRTETRSYAVNTQSRRYPVPAETRTAPVDTQTRILKQKGYNS